MAYPSPSPSANVLDQQLLKVAPTHAQVSSSALSHPFGPILAFFWPHFGPQSRIEMILKWDKKKFLGKCGMTIRGVQNACFGTIFGPSRAFMTPWLSASPHRICPFGIKNRRTMGQNVAFQKWLWALWGTQNHVFVTIWYAFLGCFARPFWTQNPLE